MRPKIAPVKRQAYVKSRYNGSHTSRKAASSPRVKGHLTKENKNMATPFNAAYTFPQHRISVTDNLRAGNALSAANQLTGVPVSLLQFEVLGAVNVAATNNILTATPFAGAGSVPRNATP